MYRCLQSSNCIVLLLKFMQKVPKTLTIFFQRIWTSTWMRSKWSSMLNIIISSNDKHSNSKSYLCKHTDNKDQTNLGHSYLYTHSSTQFICLEADLNQSKSFLNKFNIMKMHKIFTDKSVLVWIKVMISSLLIA